MASSHAVAYISLWQSDQQAPTSDVTNTHNHPQPPSALSIDPASRPFPSSTGHTRCPTEDPEQDLQGNDTSASIHLHDDPPLVAQSGRPSRFSGRFPWKAVTSSNNSSSGGGYGFFLNSLSGANGRVDPWNSVYFSMVLAGIGFLLPYNSFVNAADLYRTKFCSASILFHFSATYLSVMVIAVAINNVLVTRISFHVRISIGWCLAFVPLCGFTLLDVCLGLFSPSTSYSLTLLAGALVSLGCTIQQSSYYGYTSMLPRRYIQAVMMGESLSGLLVSLLRLLFELVFPSRPAVFFLVSSLILAICFITFRLTLRSPLVQFYLNRADSGDHVSHGNNNMTSSIGGQNGGVGRPGTAGSRTSGASGTSGHQGSALREASWSTENLNLVRGERRWSADNMADLAARLPSRRGPPPPPSQTAGDAGVSRMGRSLLFDPVPTGTANQAYLFDSVTALNHEEPPELEDELDLDDDDYEDYEIMKELPDLLESSETRNTPIGLSRHRNSTTWKSGVQIRLEIIRVIWRHMLSIASVYFVTMSLYPGLQSEIPSQHWPKFIPIILLVAFNLADFVGKLLSALSVRWTGVSLLIATFLRCPLVLLILLCAVPPPHPVISSDWGSVALVALLGLSNGYFGSVTMISAPQLLPTNYREIAGNIMSVCYNFGLTTGSIFAFALHSIVQLSTPAGMSSSSNFTDSQIGRTASNQTHLALASSLSINKLCT